MSVHTDYNKINSKSVTIFQNEEQTCDTTVHETVCVQGTVTITPKVESEPCNSYCVGNPMIGSCLGELEETCEFTVSQEICVEIPLSFSACASAEEDGIVCGTPEIGPCQGTTACTHTIGFYKNHPDDTNALITEAGGSIILGINDDGLSYTVTTTNANDVLSFNTPSPPAPEDPPFSQQYQVLYAQLLAANLNVIAIEAEGAEICTFATQSIENANNFLATSPEGGKAGAPGFQEPLDEFNRGVAPGCPMHCDED